MRASKVCSHFDCPNIQPCPDHERKPWEGSTRRANAKAVGATATRRRRYVLRRDNLTCHMCGQIKLEHDLVADHVIPLAEGGPDTTDNVKALCLDCDRIKTQAEAQRGRRAGR